MQTVVVAGFAGMVVLIVEVETVVMVSEVVMLVVYCAVEVVYVVGVGVPPGGGLVFD